MRRSQTGKIALLVVIAVAWVALDQWTKSFFVGVSPNTSFGLVLGGLVDIFLVHNTGAAWGIFAGNTVALGWFSVTVVAVMLVFFFWKADEINLMQTVGIALIAAGGVGNAIDRFVQGFVTDFIAVTFIDFPVFNVADIGVTCGVVILVIGFFLEAKNESNGQSI